MHKPALMTEQNIRPSHNHWFISYSEADLLLVNEIITYRNKNIN